MSEFLALKTAIEEVIAIRYTLRSFGMKVEKPTRVKCDNESVVKSSTLADSVLKKRHVAIAYHMARESQAAGIIQIQSVCSANNLAGIFTKNLNNQPFHNLTKSIMYSHTYMNGRNHS